MNEEEPKKVEEKDDRDEIVEITYGDRAATYVTEKATKKYAFERLYSYYIGTQMKMVPKTNASGEPVNQAVVYVKFRRRDPYSGKELVSYKDLPLWIAVDRALNRGYHIELISKEEHDKFYADKQRPEDELSLHLAQERLKGNIQQPIMIRK